MTRIPCLALLGLVLVGGCAVSTDPKPETVAVVGESTLIVTWTLDGTASANACSAEGADSIEILVRAPTGQIISTFLEDCKAAMTEVSLPPGDYDASAVLVGGGHAITTRVQLGSVTLERDGEQILDADFKSESFYGRGCVTQ